MSKETKYGIPSLKADFPNDAACLMYIFKTLHSTKCSCGGTYALITGRKSFQCSLCRYQIAPCKNTIFEKSSTPLTLWFQALMLFSNSKSGVSAKTLERELEVTYKCAWRILSQIRKSLPQPTRPLTGKVEIDTGYIGGREKAGKNNKRKSQVIASKSVVVVAVERGGEMRAKILPNSGGATIQKFIKDSVQKKGTTLITDAAGSYIALDTIYKRYKVTHYKKEYVRGNVHINTAEMFFGHLKRSFRGTFKVISKQHLQTYLDSFVFLYNNRRNDRHRFEEMLGALLPV